MAVTEQALDPDGDFGWTGVGPLGEIEVRKDAAGVWRVTYAGLSYSSSGSLTEALRAACSTGADATWLHDLAHRILPRPGATLSAGDR